jgi:hypothetical protein
MFVLSYHESFSASPFFPVLLSPGWPNGWSADRLKPFLGTFTLGKFMVQTKNKGLSTNQECAW